MGKLALGIELGSTRIKAVAVDEGFAIVSSGDYTWKSVFENGLWTYPLSAAWEGLNKAVSGIENRDEISAVTISSSVFVQSTSAG